MATIFVAPQVPSILLAESFIFIYKHIIETGYILAPMPAYY